MSACYAAVSRELCVLFGRLVVGRRRSSMSSSSTSPAPESSSGSQPALLPSGVPFAARRNERAGAAQGYGEQLLQGLVDLFAADPKLPLWWPQAQEARERRQATLQYCADLAACAADEQDLRLAEAAFRALAAMLAARVVPIWCADDAALWDFSAAAIDTVTMRSWRPTRCCARLRDRGPRWGHALTQLQLRCTAVPAAEAERAPVGAGARLGVVGAVAAVGRKDGGGRHAVPVGQRRARAGRVLLRELCGCASIVDATMADDSATPRSPGLSPLAAAIGTSSRPSPRRCSSRGGLATRGCSPRCGGCAACAIIGRLREGVGATYRRWVELTLALVNHKVRLHWASRRALIARRRNASTLPAARCQPGAGAGRQMRSLRTASPSSS